MIWIGCGHSPKTPKKTEKPKTAPVVVVKRVACWDGPGKVLADLIRGFRWPDPRDDGITELTVNDAAAFQALLSSLIDYIEVQLEKCAAYEPPPSPM